MKKNKQKRKLELQHFNSFDELYESVTKEGSLGLLALGYKGLLLWRKKRTELESKEESKVEKK